MEAQFPQPASPPGLPRYLHPDPCCHFPQPPASRQHRTWSGHQAGLEGAWLSGRGGVGPLHGGAILRARAGQGFGQPAAPLQCLMDGRRVGGQVGQLVEDTALPDDGIDQVGVACGRGVGGVSARPPCHPLHQSSFLGWGELGGRRGVSTPRGGDSKGHRRRGVWAGLGRGVG